MVLNGTLTYLQLQQPGCTRRPRRPASERSAEDGYGGGSHCATLQGGSSENIGESFYRSVIIDPAVGSMTADGSGFVSFTSVQRNRPAIHHPSFPQSSCPSLRRSISIGWSHLGTGCRSDFITTAGEGARKVLLPSSWRSINADLSLSKRGCV